MKVSTYYYLVSKVLLVSANSAPLNSLSLLISLIKASNFEEVLASSQKSLALLSFTDSKTSVIFEITYLTFASLNQVVSSMKAYNEFFLVILSNANLTSCSLFSKKAPPVSTKLYKAGSKTSSKTQTVFSSLYFLAAQPSSSFYLASDNACSLVFKSLKSAYNLETVSYNYAISTFN